MAILKGNSLKSSDPVVAKDLEKYGLQVAPKSTSHSKAGLQANYGKWAYLFTSDEEGVCNLLNVLDYIAQKAATHEEWEQVRKEAEKFVKEFPEWLAKRTAA